MPQTPIEAFIVGILVPVIVVVGVIKLIVECIKGVK